MTLFDWSSLSEKGPHHERNDDDVLGEPGYGIFVIADGMGGRPGGSQASRVAVRTFMDHLRRVNPAFLTDEGVLCKAVAAANKAVLAIAQAEPLMAGMGTTLSAAVIAAQGSRIVHVGDSRIYKFTGGRLEQLTEDHTVISELVANRMVTDAMAKQLSLDNVLSRAVGTRPHVDPDIYDLSLRPGEWLLLATDGLTKALPDAKLQALFAAHEKAGAHAVCQAMMQEALAASPLDNVTLGVLRTLGKS